MRSFSNTNFVKNYVVLLFFPNNWFALVDLSELMAFRGNLQKLAKNDCHVVGVTSDDLHRKMDLIGA